MPSPALVLSDHSHSVDPKEDSEILQKTAQGRQPTLAAVAHNTRFDNLLCEAKDNAMRKLFTEFGYQRVFPTFTIHANMIIL